MENLDILEKSPNLAFLRTMIFLDASNSEILDYFSSVMTEINRPNKSYELDSANRVYVKQDFQLLDSYKQILTEKFQGQFENIDFSNANAAAQVKFLYCFKKYENFRR